MKIVKCSKCGDEIEVYDEYEPEYCCDGRACCCYGEPIDPVYCDKCEEEFYYFEEKGEIVEEDETDEK